MPQLKYLKQRKIEAIEKRLKRELKCRRCNQPIKEGWLIQTKSTCISKTRTWYYHQECFPEIE